MPDNYSQFTAMGAASPAQGGGGDYSQFQQIPTKGGAEDYSQFKAVSPPAASPQPAPQQSPGLVEGAIDYMDNAIQSVGQSKPVQSLKANWDQAVDSGLFMEPTRAVMEGVGYGRQPGESDAALHARYNQAITNARADAQQRAQANTVGAYDGDPVHIAERAAQQVGNVGAGIAASPYYALIPGMGIGGTVGARVATSVLSNAGVGGVSDAAAQLMDVAEGQKKNFDIQQNLENTVMGGVAGGVMHGAVEVAPFVKGLFSARGMDTTPNANPLQSTARTPMTGSQVVLNPAEQGQYRQLLQTGSVDDIKNFLAGRQGPKPSYQAVNQWVEYRDANQMTGATPKTLAPQDPEVWRQQVEQHVNDQTANWKNAPDVQVVHSPTEIADPAIRDSAVTADTDGTARGMYGADGKAYLFSGRINGPDLANAALFHEGLGHFGLDQQFGDRLNSVMQNLYDRNVGNVRKTADQYIKENPGSSPALATEEALAQASQNGALKPTWHGALLTTVRQFARKMGLNLSYSDGEIMHILSMAHDAVINGKPNVRANGYSNGQKFMFTGPKSRDFSAIDPTVYQAKDGGIRNEIDDSQSREIPVEKSDPSNPYMKYPYKLEDVLHHPQLFEKYPHLRDLPVIYSNLKEREGLGGYYDSDIPHIGLDNGPGILTKTGFADSHSVLLHEVQHAIQHYEGHMEGDYAGTAHLSEEEHDQHPLEQEAVSTELRRGMTTDQRAVKPPKFMKSDALGREVEEPVDMMDRLKADPRYWNDPEYRKNVNEMARTQFPAEQQNQNKFMRESQVAPEDVASEAFDRLSDGFSGKSRSWDESMDAARDTAIDPAALSKVRGVGNIDQLLFKYDNAAKELNGRLQASATKVAAGEPLTAEEHAQRIEDVANFHYVLGRIENDSAQVARALNAMKAVEFSRNNLLSLKAALDEAGTLGPLTDPDNMNKFLQQYQALGNEKGGQMLARDLTKPRWEKYALTLYRNILLSGMGTHWKAPQDMATGIALDLEDRLGAIPIGKIHDGLQALGITKQGGMHGREAIGYLYGAMRAVIDGSAWSKAMEALANPHSQTLRMSNEAPAVLPGMAGKVTTIPTRLIAAQDAFFRAISTNAHLYGSGIAKSLAEGDKLSWTDHLDRGVSYGQNPTSAMLKDAKARANSALLLADNPLTKFLERGKKITTGADPLDRAVTAAIDLITPIIRVPANSLLSRVIARSPAGLLDPETRQMFFAGGRQTDIAISRMLVGSLKLALMWAAGGTVGNMLSGNNRKEAEAAGWRPNSVHENGGYSTGNQLSASINPWDMHNSTATMVADIREAWQKGANEGQIGTAFKLAGSRLMHDMYSQLWMGDVSNAMGMFSDNPADTGSATRTIGNIVSSAVVPNAVAQFRAFTDPNQHDTSVPNSISGSIANQIQARIPGLSNSVPDRYSVYGDPLQTGSNIIGTHNWLTGGNRVPEVTDEAEHELDRLNNSLASLKQPDDVKWPSTLITPVQRKVEVNGKTKALTTPEFELYQHVAGANIVQKVHEAMSTPAWQQMSDHDRVLQVQDIVSDQKYAAREQLFNQ